MGWVNSLDLFYFTSETVTDIVNAAFPGTHIPPNPYTPTKYIYNVSPGVTDSYSQLQYTDLYMDDINCLT